MSLYLNGIIIVKWGNIVTSEYMHYIKEWKSRKELENIVQNDWWYMQIQEPAIPSMPYWKIK